MCICHAEHCYICFSRWSYCRGCLSSTCIWLYVCYAQGSKEVSSRENPVSRPRRAQAEFPLVACFGIPEGGPLEGPIWGAATHPPHYSLAQNPRLY